MVVVLLELEMGGPAGGGCRGLNQSCCRLTVGLVQVPVNVTAELVLQFVAWLLGETDVVGGVVKLTIAKVWELPAQRVPLEADTVYTPGLVKVARLPVTGGLAKEVQV